MAVKKKVTPTKKAAPKKVALKKQAVVKKAAAKPSDIKAVKKKTAKKAGAKSKSLVKPKVKSSAKTKKNTVKKTATKPKSSGTKAGAVSSLKKAATKKPPYKKPKKDEECFLTTACVTYYDLPDNAYELTTLRSFRDTYMATKPKGKQLIAHYYTIAPTLVVFINKDKDRKTIYASIFTVIQKACAEIEKKHFVKAQNTYLALVKNLQEKYLSIS
jgi:hypothetical protein